jgi:hypothetical protein
MAELIYNGKSLKMYCTPKCGISNFRYMVKNGIFEISHVNDSSSNNWLKNIGGQVKNYENINHTRDVVVEGAYDMTPDELIKVGIPNNYNYFYNEELIEMVGNIFKKDIDRFNLEYPYKK